MRIHRSECPACHSKDISEVLVAEDHTVSHERFPIWHCGQCTLRFTQDAPTAEAIGPYYQSEEYISHSNTSKGLINGLYQRVRAITLSQKLSLVRRVSGLPSGSLLDVGCGTGEFLNTMSQAGWATRGLEPDEGARSFAKTHYGLDVDDTSELFSLANPYDVITLWHVLEHVHELHPYLDQLRGLIGKTGVLLIAVPNYTSPDAKSYGSAWAAYDVPRHLYHFSPASMERLLAQHGITVTEMLPMPFDGFYVSMLSEKYRGGGKADELLGGVRRGLETLAAGAKAATRSSSVIYVCRVGHSER